ncbi:hypothetical protein [Sphingorhabdus sp. Alg231-15]|uniref:hypothetical protein n=1 Tax=Sphingorhabdus sp. Alg231-15 TaxID=1922222 RepID=UPI000D55A0B3
MKIDWRALLAMPLLIAGIIAREMYHNSLNWWKATEELASATEKPGAPIYCFGDCGPIPQEITIWGHASIVLFILGFSLLVWITLKVVR